MGSGVGRFVRGLGRGLEGRREYVSLGRALEGGLG